MTQAQEIKLKTIKNVLNYYENNSGALIIETTYGTSRFIRLFIGKNGGFCGNSIVYKNYDLQDKKPSNKLFQINN